MSDALTIAVSGLNLQSMRVGAAAQNLVNSFTTGALPDGDGPPVYQPVEVVAQSGPEGVRASVRTITSPSKVVYDPVSPFANPSGLVGMPMVSQEREVVSLVQARMAYKANIKVIEAQTENDRSLSEIL